MTDSTEITSNSAETTDDDVISTNIRQQRNNLVYLINVNFGLLDAVGTAGILPRERIETIQTATNVQNRVEQLLDDIVRLTRDKVELFLDSLDKTRQSHVVKFIRSNGVRDAAAATSDWPVSYSTNETSRIDKHWAELVEQVDARNGLLDELLAVGYFNYRQKEYIERGDTHDDIISRLLYSLCRKSIDDYYNLVKCLLKTKQYHVASLLAPDMVANAQTSVSEEHKNRLLVNHAALVKLIDTKHGLLTEMLSADCITDRQKEYVEAASTPTDSNSRILDIVRRGSEQDFNSFVVCLQKNGQKHVGDILCVDGVVTHLVAKTAGSGNLKDDEMRIVDRFKAVLDNCSTECREQLFDNVRKHVDELRRRDAELVAVQTESSIGFFFFFKSLSGLHYLWEVFLNGELHTEVVDIFDTLLIDTDGSIAVESVEWHTTDYINSARYLCKVTGLTEFERMYNMAMAAQTPRTSASTVSFDIHKFPFELVEMVLHKAAIRLFVTLVRVTPRAEVYTLVTLCAVSQLWWRTFTYRHFTKRLLQRSFRSACSPFKCSPIQVEDLVTEPGRSIYGVVESGGKLYIAITKAIQVFTNEPSFVQVDEYKVPDLKDPTDVAVCPETGQLYVPDRDAQIIWKVNPLSDDSALELFIATEFRPYSLSLSKKSCRIYVTTADNDAVFVYGRDGILIKRLPVYARHAVETSRDTIIVSHILRLIDGKPTTDHDVSEVDFHGLLLRKHHHHVGNVLQFDDPYFFLLDAGNNVIVADRRNKRIVLLKPDLQLNRVLIPSLPGSPRRMSLCQKSGLLYVAYSRLPFISVYSVLTSSLNNTQTL